MNSIVNNMSKMSLTGTPNLGGKQLKLVAKDDAVHVGCYRVTDVASGKIAMPFRHAEFAKAYYSSFNDKLYGQFTLIGYFSQIRNHRVMRKCNEVILKHEGKKLFTLTEEMNELDARLPEFLELARSIGVDPSLYLDDATDIDDVEQCTNSWCLNQNPTRGKASDNIIVITDLDGIDWFVLIERQNGPGRAQKAWAGGFVDKGETFAQAALREGSEEVGMDMTGTFTTTVTELPVIISNDWDPRAKFVEGMENGATVTHYRFTCA